MRIRPSAPGPQLAMADPAGELRLFGLGDEALPVVDEHEIVAAAVHFVEGDAVLHAFVGSDLCVRHFLVPKLLLGNASVLAQAELGHLFKFCLSKAGALPQSGFPSGSLGTRS